jgi:hypothetical protein
LVKLNEGDESIMHEYQEPSYEPGPVTILKDFIKIDFRYGVGPYRVRDRSIPESAVAYDETHLLQLLCACGLELREPVHYGTWSGREHGLSYQGILLVRTKNMQHP